jgi:hypothetical protein
MGSGEDTNPGERREHGEKMQESPTRPGLYFELEKAKKL